MRQYLPVAFALLTGLFWGLYGPALTQSRSAGGGNAFKPYVMIGIAYLVWGILGGLVGMWQTKQTFTFTGAAAGWGLIAGTLGAWGALTLTLAMFSGGRPHTVMPLVFGTAVAVSALTAVVMTRTTGSPILWAGIVGMAICIVVVAANTPHAAPHRPSPTASVPPASTAEHGAAATRR